VNIATKLASARVPKADLNEVEKNQFEKQRRKKVFQLDLRKQLASMINPKD
jgi:hypothetical protein